MGERNEFLRLQRGDTEALLAFLRTVGLFARPEHLHATRGMSETTIVFEGSHYDARYISKITENDIWGVRRLIDGSIKALSQETGEHHAFQVRIVRPRHGKPRLMLTTTTFLEALLLTLSVDQAKEAKVQKCARPDCGVSFSITGGRKRKYCEPYCGHIESVRKDRREAKRTQARGKPTLARRRGRRE